MKVAPPPTPTATGDTHPAALEEDSETKWGDGLPPVKSCLLPLHQADLHALPLVSGAGVLPMDLPELDD